MDWTWISTTPSEIVMTVLTAVAMYVALIAFTRLAGLRSFSKLSSFDFAITVSFGTLFASAILTKDPPVFRALFALGFIYALQHGITRLRIHSGLISRLVDNAPLLVMDGSTILEENLSRSGITKADLRSKLREANVLRWEQVRAVVVETTGDVTVLHASADDESTLDRSLLAGVRGVDERS